MISNTLSIRRGRLGAVLAAAGVLGSAAAAAPPAGAAVIGFERGERARFAQLNDANGTLVKTRARAYTGARSARATYDGHGANGYARGIARVSWQEGETVAYGAAFRLDRGFKADMEGPVSLIRWDNWPSDHDNGDVGGLVILQRDKRVHLIEGGYGRGFESDLIGGVRIPEGRWVHLEVRQRFASRDGAARSTVYVNGRRVGRSRAANMSGRRIQRLRVGLVSMAAGRQFDPLSLHFDQVTIGRRVRGPR